MMLMMMNDIHLKPYLRGCVCPIYALMDGFEPHDGA